MLSSDTEQITQGSLGFHEKSEIFAVWPPWINCHGCRYTSELEVHKKMKNPTGELNNPCCGLTSSSGGPSSASSADCSSPILLQACQNKLKLRLLMTHCYTQPFIYTDYSHKTTTGMFETKQDCCLTSGPRRWDVCLFHWRPGLSRYEETTEPATRNLLSVPWHTDIWNFGGHIHPTIGGVYGAYPTVSASGELVSEESLLWLAVHQSESL